MTSPNTRPSKYALRKPTIWRRHEALILMVTSIVNLSKVRIPQCCSPWAVHRVSRLTCSAVALVGTVIYCIFIIRGKEQYSTLSYPLLITTTLCAVLYIPSQCTSARKQSQCCISSICGGPYKKYFRGGDPNMNIIATLVVVIPITSYFLVGIINQFRESGIPSSEKEHGHLSNICGKLSALCMSFFLVPVAKHSILLKCVGLDPNHAVRVHIWAGTAALVGGLSHGLYWILIWILQSEETFGEKVIPHSNCWTLNNYDSNDEKLCIAHFVNLLGILAGLCFIVLGFTSMWWVRRNYYNVFITCHVICSVLLLFLLTMHYYKMILYIAPSLLYYLSSSMPIWIKSILSWMQGGILVTNTTHISNGTTEGCVEMSFSYSNQGSKFETCCGKYVKICVPEISAVWHPFSIYHSNDNSDLRIMFQGTTGPFTKALSKRLQQSPNPTVLVDGLYGGETRISDALLHKTVVIIAGGVGITSYISMIFLLCSELSKGDRKANENTFEDDPFNFCFENATKKVIIHWLCRDEELIEYFNELYFAKLDGFHIHIVIHHTKKNAQQHGNQCSIMEGHIQQNLSMDDSQMQLQSSSTGKLERKRGLNFEPGALSWGMKGKVFYNLPQAILFAFIAWGGNWLIFYFYKNVQGKFVAVYKRSLIVMALTAFSIVSCLIYFLVTKIVLLCSPVASCTIYENIKNNSIDSIEFQQPTTSLGGQGEEGSTNISDTDQSTFGKENRSSERIGVQHCYGRPDVAMIVSHILELEDVGLFLCTPVSLKKYVKDLVAAGQRQCAIYEEISEL